MKKKYSIGLLAWICFLLLTNSLKANTLPVQLQPGLVLNELDNKEQATLLWKGFHHTWEHEPHRVNQLGSYFRNISYDTNTKHLSAEHHALFSVGAVRDQGDVSSKGQFIKSQHLGFYHNYVGESCLTVEGEVGNKESVECEEEINLEELGWDYDSVNVVLRGFQLTSTSYDNGYNTRGFAIRLIPVGKEGSVYRFKAFFQIHPEHSPDRPLADDHCGRDDHCDRYEYQARIYYTLIGVNDDDGQLTARDHSGSSQTVKMSPYKVPEKVVLASEIQGDLGFNKAFLGIQGFSWLLGEWDSTKKDGRYLREIFFDVFNFDYDGDTGRGTYKANMYFHNSSAWPYGYDVDYEMWTIMVQVNDRALEKSDNFWFKGEIEAGDSSFTEEVDYDFE